MIHIICWALAIVFLFPFIEQTVKFLEQEFPTKKVFYSPDCRVQYDVIY